MFSSLHVRNYRLWVSGALVSNIGTWMQRVAQDWLVLTILTDHSGTATGITTGLQFLPILFLGPYAGLIADRHNKRSILFVTQSVMGLCALTLGILVGTGNAELWQVYLIAFTLGIASAFDAPARQAFVSDLVGSGDVPNAVALNSASFNMARLFGPGLAGLLIAVVGVAPAFYINALSFAAVIFSLTRMRPAEFQLSTRAPRGSGQVREGLAYVKGRPDLLLILGLAFIVATFGLNFQVTNAMMATIEFGVGPGEFGLLGTLMGIGTLGGALLAARRNRPRLRYLLGGAIGFGFFGLLAAIMPGFWWYAIMLIPVGLAAITFLNSCNTTIQLSVEPQYRGRVLALYMSVVQGGTPIGAPLVGWLGTEFGPRWGVAGGSIIALVAGIIATILVIRRRGLGAHLRNRARALRDQVNPLHRGPGGADPDGGPADAMPEAGGRKDVGDVVEITTRLQRHFSSYATPGVPGAAASAASATGWIRDQVTGAADAAELSAGARAGLDAMRGGMGSLTDTFVGVGPADYDMIADSWDRLRGALRNLL